MAFACQLVSVPALSASPIVGGAGHTRRFRAVDSVKRKLADEAGERYSGVLQDTYFRTLLRLAEAIEKGLAVTVKNLPRGLCLVPALSGERKQPNMVTVEFVITDD